MAPYSEYVHGGTGFARGKGYIYSRMGYANRAFIDANIGTWHEGNIDSHGNMTGEGRWGILPIPGGMFMTLPPGAGHSRRFHLRVRGQLANAFLYRGWNRANVDLARGEMGELVQPVGFLTPPGVGKAKSRF
jgi:hypothetical protein